MKHVYYTISYGNTWFNSLLKYNDNTSTIIYTSCFVNSFTNLILVIDIIINLLNHILIYLLNI